MTVEPPTTPVLARYGWAEAELERIAGGLINATFAVRRGGEPIAVIQRLHPVFGAEVNLDIDAITAHLAARGLITPRLVRTQDGAASIVDDGHVWRALSWVDGVAIHAVPDPAWARHGGELVGRFHRAVHDLEHRYQFVRAGVHDTAAHLARLAERVARSAAAGDAAESAETLELAREILAAAAALPPMPALPLRHAHGDLKISNLLYRAAPPAAPEAIALVDLDTLGRQTLAFELGDAMRSWCNPHGEDAGRITFDLPIFAAAIAGWRDVAGPLFNDDERAAIVVGLETVCLELAARFAVDAFDDAYFGWDPARFPTRRAHNRVRARGQLALGRAVGAAREAARDLLLSDLTIG